MRVNFKVQKRRYRWWAGTVILRYVATVALLAGVMLPGPGQAESPRLKIDAQGNPNENLRVLGFAPEGNLYRLYRSTDLAEWQSLATIHHIPFEFIDLDTAGVRAEFYQLRMSSWGDAEDWKNLIELPDSFGTWGESGVRWVKFNIFASDPHKVIFQDSGEYALHYDFMSSQFDRFGQMSEEEFYELTRGEDAELYLGAVLYPAEQVRDVYGIQFVGQYPKELFVELFEIVKTTVDTGSNLKAVYIPKFEQEEFVFNNREYLSDHGIEVGSTESWTSQDVWYSKGWAIGQLKYVPAEEISQAFTTGELTSEDILMTDAVPADTPLVAGIITFSPSTPNSHIAIGAQAEGVPFVFVREEEDRDKLMELAGKEVLFPAREVEAIELAGFPEVKAHLTTLKERGPVEITPKAHLGSLVADTADLYPEDLRHFGGKAANFGELRRTIPEHSPEAIAFSFDLWDAFLDQELSDGQTLRATIDERLSHYSYPPENPAALQNDLIAVRHLISSVAQFTPEQKENILEALSGFSPNRKLRVRSSTNVEDTKELVGAGLYTSFSGCLADDMDNDEEGPSACDPQESNEEGVLEAMQKVFASFYNEQAFLIRRRHGINESEVGMALLVHHSFPDSIEMANGVATVKRESGLLITEAVLQVGAVSVANPDTKAAPEVVRMEISESAPPGTERVSWQQRSDLVPLGGIVLDDTEEYRELNQLFRQVVESYVERKGDEDFTLNFEFKKMQPGQLVVKQVRELPRPSSERVTPWLLADEVDFVNSSMNKIFAVHDLKSRWQLKVPTMQLSSENLEQGLYSGGTVTLVRDGQIQTMDFPPPDGEHSVNQGTVIHRWTEQLSSGTRTFELATIGPETVSLVEPPVVLLSDLELRLKVTYSVPFFYPPSKQERRRYSGKLVPEEILASAEEPVVMQFDSDQVSIETTFLRPETATPYHPERLDGNVYALDVIEGWDNFFVPKFARFDQTKIIGLTSEPILLSGRFSQTRGVESGNHNGWDEFLFEPQLDPDITAEQRQQLDRLGIHQLAIHDRFDHDSLGGHPRIEYLVSFFNAEGSVVEVHALEAYE